MENRTLYIEIEEITIKGHIVVSIRQPEEGQGDKPLASSPGPSSYKTNHKVALQVVDLGEGKKDYEVLIDDQKISLDEKQFTFLRELALKLLRDTKEKKSDKDRGWVNKKELSTDGSKINESKSHWFDDRFNREIYELRKKLEVADPDRKLLEARKGFYRLSTHPNNLSIEEE